MVTICDRGKLLCKKHTNMQIMTIAHNSLTFEWQGIKLALKCPGADIQYPSFRKQCKFTKVRSKTTFKYVSVRRNKVVKFMQYFKFQIQLSFLNNYGIHFLILIRTRNRYDMMRILLTNINHSSHLRHNCENAIVTFTKRDKRRNNEQAS